MNFSGCGGKRFFLFLILGSSVFESYGGSGPRSGGGGGGSSAGGSKLSVKKERSDEETKEALDFLLRDDVSSHE